MRKKIIPYNPKLKTLASKLRKNSTKSEIELWSHLRNKQFHGLDFDRQKPIDNYIVDFFCNEIMLAIELDGVTHHWEETQKKDIVKQSRLEELGIAVLRFEDGDVLNHTQSVLERLEEFLIERGKEI